jgi:hypothetical protein
LGKFLNGLGIQNVGLFFGHVEYFTAVCYILRPLGNVVVVFPVLVDCVKKNLATLVN